MLGLTNYKSYVGSNLGKKWKLFYDEGMKIGDSSAYFANPLGNQVAIVLKDGKHVIMNRSFQVAESQGKLTCVGGHPEPSVSFLSFRLIKGTKNRNIRRCRKDLELHIDERAVREHAS